MNAKRFLTFVCACSTALLLLSPANAAAQRGGSHGGGGGHATPSHPSGGGGGRGPGPGAQARPRGGHPGYPGGGYYRPSYGYRGSYGYYRPYYYSPYFYNGFYASFYYGLGWYPSYWSYAYGYPWGYYGYYGYPYYGSGYSYPGYAYGAWSSARLEMKPRDAQVFVDGYYVGTVDNFDGVFQRLDIPAGQHELTVYMPGYHTWKQQVLFQPGQGYHYKGDLEPLPPGAAPEPRPQPANPPRNNGNYGPPDNAGPPNEDPNAGGNYVYPQGPYRQPPPPPGGDRRTQPMPGNESGNFGTLNLRVQPGDATVQIDGERWDSPEGGSRLVVQLAAGPHRIEVRKDGYRPYSTTIQIRPGEPQTINVVLPQTE